ncbi:unnamed protein product [Polarella glacialis]|uniref:Exostosin GT47 domain-containing protein n=1 Tax=Polarella glacialis TaxID=89957 RepID=A0A813FZN7_POLGL|nr:unnamed protein product [Polarella glacialis]
MSNSLFSDPNCTSSELWSAWRDSITGLSLGLEASEGGFLQSEQAQAAEEKALDLELHSDVSCYLGAAALMLAQVAGSWRRGRFFAALQTFAILHDQYLTDAHPGFFEHSAWPISDLAVRAWKDRLLFQTRRFREIAGRHISDEGLLDLNLEDPVERENIGGFASHVIRQRQLLQGRLGLLPSEAGEVFALAETMPPPSWEFSPAAALVPSLRDLARPPLRIYVYNENDAPALGRLTRAPAFCHYRQWGMDVGFHDFFRTSPLRTLDPDEADYFFVPSYACCHQVAGMSEFDELEADHAAVVQQLRYFGRSGGRDHIFSFHYVDLFPGWRKHIPQSIFLTPETEVGFERSLEEFDVDQSRFPPFNPAKDMSVPPYINMRDILGFNQHARPLSEREHIAAFTGKLWVDVAEATEVRGRVAALAGIPGFAIHAYGSIQEMYGPVGMQSLMGNSRFCLVPRGRAAWSVRFFEALWAGCVPVLLSDYYEPPFDALFDITEFVIKWPVAKIDSSLVEFLSTMPLEVVERYAAAAHKVRCWYLYPPPEVSWLGNWETRRELEQVEKEICPNLSSSRNAFQAVAEILSRRVRRTKVAPGSFYSPDPDGNAAIAVDAQLRPL